MLTNPYDRSASVDIGFATADGSRQPPELQGDPVAAAVGADHRHGLDRRARRGRGRGHASMSTRGHAVVGRAQVYDGDGRLGYSMTLASPALRSQWWFANGDKGAGVIERFSIYNPTEDDVEVAPLFLGTQGTRGHRRPDQGAGPCRS